MYVIDLVFCILFGLGGVALVVFGIVSAIGGWFNDKRFWNELEERMKQ